MEDDEDVRYVHLPREVFFGYPIDPETGDVPRDYIDMLIRKGMAEVDKGMTADEFLGEDDD